MKVKSSMFGSLVLAPSLMAACAHAQQPDSAGASRLPVIEVPALKSGRTLALFMTGDGGWATLDRHVASELAKNGVAVIGLNSREYLQHEKSPDQIGLDMTRLARV